MYGAVILTNRNLALGNYTYCDCPAASSCGARIFLPRHMRRDCEPSPAPLRPHIGIAAVPLRAVGRLVARPRVDDRDIAEEADADVVDGEAADRHRPRGLCQELLAVDERAVGVGAEEIPGQDLVEAAHVAVLHRGDVVAVERGQYLEIAAGRVIRCRGLHGRLPGNAVHADSSLGAHVIPEKSIHGDQGRKRPAPPALTLTLSRGGEREYRGAFGESRPQFGSSVLGSSRKSGGTMSTPMSTTSLSVLFSHQWR
jgi:hypothetical protein